MSSEPLPIPTDDPAEEPQQLQSVASSPLPLARIEDSLFRIGGMDDLNQVGLEHLHLGRYPIYPSTANAADETPSTSTDAAGNDLHPARGGESTLNVQNDPSSTPPATPFGILPNLDETPVASSSALTDTFSTPWGPIQGSGEYSNLRAVTDASGVWDESYYWPSGFWDDTLGQDDGAGPSIQSLPAPYISPTAVLSRPRHETPLQLSSSAPSSPTRVLSSPVLLAVSTPAKPSSPLKGRLPPFGRAHSTPVPSIVPSQERKLSLPAAHARSSTPNSLEDDDGNEAECLSDDDERRFIFLRQWPKASPPPVPSDTSDEEYVDALTRIPQSQGAFAIDPALADVPPLSLDDSPGAASALVLETPSLPPQFRADFNQGAADRPFNEDDYQHTESALTTPAPKKAKKRAPKAETTKTNFKIALWATINNPVYSKWIHWSEDGLTGIVEDKSKFEGSKAMAAITDARDVGGFVRQLHMWGFRRFRVPELGKLSCGFEHDLFRRGRADLMETLKRKGEGKISSKSRRSTSVKTKKSNARTRSGTATLRKSTRNLGVSRNYNEDDDAQGDVVAEFDDETQNTASSSGATGSSSVWRTSASRTTTTRGTRSTAAHVLAPQSPNIKKKKAKDSELSKLNTGDIAGGFDASSSEEKHANGDAAEGGSRDVQKPSTSTRSSKRNSSSLESDRPTKKPKTKPNTKKPRVKRST